MMRCLPQSEETASSSSISASGWALWPGMLRSRDTAGGERGRPQPCPPSSAAFASSFNSRAASTAGLELSGGCTCPNISRRPPASTLNRVRRAVGPAVVR